MSIQRMSIQRMLKKDEGFTLVELLIVIAIIAILAAIAIPQFTKYRNRAHLTALQSDAKNAYTASQAYLSDFPNTLGVPTTCCSAAQLTTGGFTPDATIITVAGAGITIAGDPLTNFTLTSSNVAAYDTATDTAVIAGDGTITFQ